MAWWDAAAEKPPGVPKAARDQPSARWWALIPIRLCQGVVAGSRLQIPGRVTLREPGTPTRTARSRTLYHSWVVVAWRLRDTERPGYALGGIPSRARPMAWSKLSVMPRA